MSILDTPDDHHHHHAQPMEKVIGTEECRPGDDAEDEEPQDTIRIGHWDQVEEGEKAIGDLFALQIDEGDLDPVDTYPEDEPGDDHALDEGGVDLDIDAPGWAKAIE
jgi:hypothetical protein